MLPDILYTHSRPPPVRRPQIPKQDLIAIAIVTNSFLNAIRKKSRSAFDQCCHPAGGVTLRGPGPNKMRFISINSYVNYIISREEDLQDEIKSAEIEVSADGNLGFLWGAFEAKVDGHLHHVGVCLFTLHKIDGQWKISGIADSWRPSVGGTVEFILEQYA
jgi:hypothetical protein